MNRLSPKRFKFALITLGLLLASFSGAQAQGKQPAKSETASNGSPINTIQDLGSSLLNSATSYVDSDPYSQFRGANYSNEGLLSERDEIKLGNQIHTEVGKKYKIVDEGQARVNRIGQRVARTSLRPRLNYQFHIISDKAINAFATPGGHVYVTTALINLATDDELSSVLAHEVGDARGRLDLGVLHA